MRDGIDSLSAVSAIAPAVYTDDPASITVDRQGFASLAFVLMFGAGGITFTNTNKIEFVLEHSNDGAAWDPVVPSNVLGAVPDTSGIVLAQKTAHAAATVHRIGYVDGIVGDRRYVRLRADFGGTHGTGTPLAAVALLGQPRQAPVAA